MKVILILIGFLIFIASYVFPQNQLIEPELIGTLPFKGSVTNRSNQIQIGQQGKIFILLGTDLVSYHQQQNQFTRFELANTDLISAGISRSSVFFGIQNFNTGPNNMLYLVYTDDNAILASDGKLSLLTCDLFQLPEKGPLYNCRIRNFAFDEIGRIFFTVLGGTNREQSQEGWSIHQYDGTETRSVAGKGNIDIKSLQIGDPPVQGKDAFLHQISEMDLFNDTLYFMHGGTTPAKIFKITSDGFITPITPDGVGSFDFTIFSEDIILAERNHAGDPRFGVFFFSPMFPEPILATVIPEINENRLRSLGLAYDRKNDDLFVSTLDEFDIALWKVSDISRVLQSHVPNWSHYE